MIKSNEGAVHMEGSMYEILADFGTIALALFMDKKVKERIGAEEIKSKLIESIEDAYETSKKFNDDPVNTIVNTLNDILDMIRSSNGGNDDEH